jgi:hypothetical protein
MKTTGFTLLVLGAMSLQLAGCARSMQTEDAKGLETAQIAKRHSFDIGQEMYYFNYEEEAEGMPEPLMRDTAVFYGLTGGYTFRDWAPVDPNESLSRFFGWRLRAEGRCAQGHVDYDGATWGGEPQTITGIDDYATEARFLVGPDFAMTNALTTLYAGFGYRYLNDDLADFPGGYERESNYCYLPIGITADRRTGERWVLGSTIEFDWLLHGRQKSHLSDMGGIDVENDQNSGFGWRVSMRFERRGEPDFIVEPFIRAWHIDKSEIEMTDGIPVLEPENSTVEAGVTLLIRF